MLEQRTQRERRLRLTAAQKLLLSEAATPAKEAWDFPPGVLITTSTEMRTATSLERKGLVTIEPGRVRTPPRAVATAAGSAALAKSRVTKAKESSMRYRVEAQRRHGATSGRVLWSEATNVEAATAKAAAVAAGMPNTYRLDGRVHRGGRYTDPAAAPGDDTTVWVVSYEPADTSAVLRRMRDRRALGLSPTA